MTTDYVVRTFANLPSEIKKYWICLPIKAKCSTSMFQSFWQPWKIEDKEIWCREIPENCISENNFPFDFDYEISDYKFNIKLDKSLEVYDCYY
jgi:predicted phosphoadenosine phosphosulfate sulfurtransferase